MEEKKREGGLASNAKAIASQMLRLLPSQKVPYRRQNILADFKKIKPYLNRKVEIGHGMFAKVYQIPCDLTANDDICTRRDIAVKVVKVRKYGNVLFDIVSFPNKHSFINASDIRDEVAFLMAVQGSSFILTHFTSKVSFGKFMVFIDLCEDGDLSSVMKHLRSNGEQGLSVKIVRLLLAPILAALAHCNRFNIMHRDIKPPNILIKHGVPQLSDFGFSVAIPQGQKTRCAEAMPLGTIGYMSPETVRVEEQNLSVDSWGVSAMALVLIHGCDGFTQAGKNWLDVSEFFFSKYWSRETDVKVDKQLKHLYSLKTSSYPTTTAQSKRDWQIMRTFLLLGMKKNINTRREPKDMLNTTYMMEILDHWQRKDFSGEFEEEYNEWMQILKDKALSGQDNALRYMKSYSSDESSVSL